MRSNNHNGIINPRTTMTVKEMVYERIKELAAKHNRPITRKEIIDSGIIYHQVETGLKSLMKSGHLQKTVRGYGYIIVGGKSSGGQTVLQKTKIHIGKAFYNR